MGTDLPTERQGQLSFITMKDSMVFYRSFYEALKDLPDSDRLQIYDAIFSYGLDLSEVKLSGIQSTIWKLIKPNIDANLRRYENGLKGAKAKQEQSKPKAKGKQKESKPKANVDVDVDDDKDKDKNNDKDKDENIYRKFAHLKISILENQKLLDAGFKQIEVDEVLLKIENYSKNKNYKSLYLTALDWLKRDKQKQFTPQPTQGYSAGSMQSLDHFGKL